MYKYTIIVLLFLNQSFLDAQISIDTIFLSSNEMIIKTNKFDNYLNSEDTLVFDEPSVSKEGMLFPSNEYLIFNMLDKEKFFVFLNGKQIYEGEGLWKFENGKQVYTNDFFRVEAIVRNGIFHGEVIQYYANSEETHYLQYKDGKRHGPTIYKNKNNVLIYFCEYFEGEKIGLEYALHNNQMIKFYNRYTNGKIDDGLYYGYDSEGNILYKKLAIGGQTTVEYF